MNFSNITVVIDRGKDEIRAGKIKAQLASGVLKFDPDSDLPPPTQPPPIEGPKVKIPIKERLEIVLGSAEFKGTFLAYAKTLDISYSSALACKKEYLAGYLGDIDEAIVDKLMNSKAEGLIKERLKIVLGFAEFKGTIRAFAKTIDRSYGFVWMCKNEYLAGNLGDIDDAIAKKLTNNKAYGLAKERLEIVLEFAEFKGTLQVFAKTIDRSYSFVWMCKNEYLDGHLGDVDSAIVEKLKRGK